MSGRAAADVSRLAVANFGDEVDRLVHDCQPRRLVFPLSRDRFFSLSLSLSPLRQSSPLVPALRRLRPSRSLARTHARTLSLALARVLGARDFLKSLFQARPRTRGELVEARATAPVF